MTQRKKAETGKPPVTIIGLGNTLYTDEGAGIHILPLLREALRDCGHAEIIEGSTDGIRLLGPVEDTDHLILLDAIRGGRTPGTLYTLTGSEIPAYCGAKLSVHQLGFQEVLFAARIRDRLPAHMVMFGVQPESLEFGIGLSKTVEACLPDLVERVCQQIREWMNDHEPAPIYEGNGFQSV